MQVIEKTHHIDITINSGSDFILPLIRSKYPDISVIDDSAEPYRGSDLEKHLDKVWKDNPGERIAAYRWSKNMTQRELSEKTGLNRVVISQLETGKRNVSVEAAKKLASALGCSFKDLL